MKLYKTFNRINGQLTSWNCYDVSVEENKYKSDWLFMVYSETERNYAPRVKGVKTKLFCYTKPEILTSSNHISELWEVDAKGVEELSFELVGEKTKLKQWRERIPIKDKETDYILSTYPHTILASSVKLIRKLDESIGYCIKLERIFNKQLQNL